MKITLNQRISLNQVNNSLADQIDLPQASFLDLLNLLFLNKKIGRENETTVLGSNVEIKTKEIEDPLQNLIAIKDNKNKDSKNKNAIEKISNKEKNSHIDQQEILAIFSRFTGNYFNNDLSIGNKLTYMRDLEVDERQENIPLKVLINSNLKSKKTNNKNNIKEKLLRFIDDFKNYINNTSVKNKKIKNQITRDTNNINDSNFPDLAEKIFIKVISQKDIILSENSNNSLLKYNNLNDSLLNNLSNIEITQDLINLDISNNFLSKINVGLKDKRNIEDEKNKDGKLEKIFSELEKDKKRISRPNKEFEYINETELVNNKQQTKLEEILLKNLRFNNEEEQGRYKKTIIENVKNTENMINKNILGKEAIDDINKSIFKKAKTEYNNLFEYNKKIFKYDYLYKKKNQSFLKLKNNYINLAENFFLDKEFKKATEKDIEKQVNSNNVNNKLIANDKNDNKLSLNNISHVAETSEASSNEVKFESENLVQRSFLKENISPEDITNFVKDFVIKIYPKGKQEAKIRLHPSSLGDIHLNIQIDKNEVKLIFTVEHPKTAELVQQQFDQLENALQSSGLFLGEAQVNLSGQNNPNFFLSQQFDPIINERNNKNNNKDILLQRQKYINKKSLIDLIV